jgi:uncharacterized protein (DUF58 family)
MLTARAWWFLVTVCLALLYGTLRDFRSLTLAALALLMWFGWEWLLFAVRLRTVLRRARVLREVLDERGPVDALWAGRTFRVSVRLGLSGLGRLPYVAVTDLVPFGVTHAGGPTGADGAVQAGRPLEMEYRVRCHSAGLARFEGLRVQLADLQGFFYHVMFLHAPLVLRILPRLGEAPGRSAVTKRSNLLPPPGIHRLHRPGSGSELLDLRDYRPGDPPRTIAWKVSARRDRLVTKEFESEVPVRSTLFVDTSNSVRVPSPQTAGGAKRGRAHAGKALDRLVELAAGVLQANAAVRDLTGLCLFDERGATVVRPDRTGTHLTQMLNLLAEAATEAPTTGRADPEVLVPLAYAFARDVYPELVRPAVNAMPFWLDWVESFPRYTRRSFSLVRSLHRHKPKLFYLAVAGLPLLTAVVDGAVFLSGDLSWPTRILVSLLAGAVSMALSLGLLLLFSGVLLVTWRVRRLARWRKRLAALLAERYGLAPGGLAALLEDDDAFALMLQRFLAEHQVPYALPLYDAEGSYLFAAPEKVPVLAKALLQAVGRGHDNELYVLFVDLLELDDRLGPLLQAVRVALGRHHQVLLVCPWPPGLERPAEEVGERSVMPRPAGHLAQFLGQAATARFHAAYQRTRRAFTRLGVPVVCAAGDEPIPLILDRLDRLRAVGGKR